MAVVRNLLVRAGADFSELQKEMVKAQKFMKSASKDLEDVGKKLTLGVTTPLLGIGTVAINAASDLEETNSKFNAVFGDMSGTVSEFAKNFAIDFGRSTQEVKENLAVIQTVGKNYGLTAEEASGLSQNLLTLANDVAAFTNTDLSDAANRMTAALRGEGEAAEALGFSINQTTLEEYARQQGIEKSIAKMSQAELVNLRYGLMVQQAGDMVGYATSEQGSFTAQLARVKGVFTDLAATMGTYLLPIITEVITKINEIMAANFEWITSNGETIIKLLGITAAIGPLLIAISKMLAFTSSVMAWGKGITAALMAVKAGTSGVGAVMTAVFGPAGVVLLVIAGIAALVAGIVYLWKNNEDFRNFLINTWNSIVEFMTPILLYISEIIKKCWSEVVVIVLPYIQQLRDFIMAAWEWLSTNIPPILNTIKEIIITAWQYVWETLQPILEGLKGTISAAWDFIKAYISKALEIISGSVKNGFEIVKNIFNTVTESIKWVWNNFGDIIVSKIKNVWDTVAGVFRGASQVLQGIFQTLTGLLTGNWSKCWEGIKNIVSGVWGAITSFVKGGVNSIISAINVFIRGINKIKVPDWIPLVGGKGFNISEIPMLAKGTDYFQGGLAIVGEQGPELVSMPRGSQVTPNRETESILSNKSTFILQTVLDGKIVAETIAPYSDIVGGNRLNLSKRGVLV